MSETEPGKPESQTEREISEQELSEIAVPRYELKYNKPRKTANGTWVRISDVIRALRAARAREVGNIRDRNL